MRKIRKAWLVLGAILGLAIIAALGLLAKHYWLITENKGASYKIDIPGKTDPLWFRLGIFLPKNLGDLEPSFDKTVNRKGVDVRVPKYVHNGRIISEANGVVSASVLETIDKSNQYLWTKDTGYICINNAVINVPESRVFDLATDLPRIKFNLYNGFFPGNLGDKALASLRDNFQVNRPSKLYLKSDQPDQDGRFELIGLVVFNTHQPCKGNL